MKTTSPPFKFKVPAFLLSLGLTFIASRMNAQIQYKQDILGEGFQQSTIHLPDDYEGKVTTTIIRKKAAKKVSKAVLYIHGFNDYFFQKEMAEQFNQHGYNFYAVDLRKYGRSLLPNQKFNNVRDLSEYFKDIDTCLSIIRAEGNEQVLLMGHSTGGLTASLYANHRKGKELFDAIFLNSPFFDLNLSNFIKNNIVPKIAQKGATKPNKLINAGLHSSYGESLHINYKGEWDYYLTFKPNKPPKVNYGWIRAIHEGQTKLHGGIEIGKPLLVMHSDKSITSKKWKEALQTADAVLNVADIQKYAASVKHIDAQGNHIPTDVQTIQDGMHDLILSKPEVRAKVYNQLFLWLEQRLK